MKNCNMLKESKDGNGNTKHETTWMFSAAAESNLSPPASQLPSQQRLCVSYVGIDKHISALPNNLLILTAFDMLNNK